MRALTVQQPWAWAIVHGDKLVENRTQNWSYRGPLAIHAGLQVSDRGTKSPLVGAAFRREHPEHNGGRVPHSAFVLGAFIGVVDLVDVHTEAGFECCRPWGESIHDAGAPEGWVTHLVLENPRPLLRPIPARGALGLWKPAPYDAQAIADEHGIDLTP